MWTSEPCTCDPASIDGNRYVQWIGTYFGDCIRTPTEKWSFGFGMVALACFVIGLVPQMWKNYQRKSVEGLSLGLLSIWALGDITNFLGAVLTHQTPTMRYTGLYFVFLSIMSFLQYFYYKAPAHSGETEPLLSIADESDPDWKPRGRPSNVTHTIDTHSSSTSIFANSTSTSPTSETTLLDESIQRSPRAYGTPLRMDRTVLQIAVAISLLSCVSAGLSERSLVMSEDPPLKLCDEDAAVAPWVEQFGIVMAWISGTLYFSSRIPQLLENHRTKSTEALSLVVFMLTIIGNITYCTAILLRQPPMDRYFFLATFPYLIGSAGTLCFDFGILGQAFIYRH
ncbi:PQ loop repeat-domain-containing protein [Phlyctochytrium arcticum]|nr:PQ loop repeat-domain-containing protein [Phlyctochytrium arcticum]